MSDQQPTTPPAPTPPKPPAVKRPRQVRAHATARPFRADGLLNVGDLVAELPTGAVASAAAWPGTRAEFAAAFRGVSDNHRDPKRPSGPGPFTPPATVLGGGVWEFEVCGEPKPGTPLGPAMDAGRLLPQVLEPVPPAEAVAVMGEAGLVRAYAEPGKNPAPPADPGGDDESDE